MPRKGGIDLRVELRLYATLRRYAPNAQGGILSLDVPEGTTVADVARQEGVLLAEVHMVMVNGVGRSLDEVLSEGDRIGLFPPVGGG